MFFCLYLCLALNLPLGLGACGCLEPCGLPSYRDKRIAAVCTVPNVKSARINLYASMLSNDHILSCFASSS